MLCIVIQIIHVLILTCQLTKLDQTCKTTLGKDLEFILQLDTLKPTATLHS